MLSLLGTTKLRVVSASDETTTLRQLSDISGDIFAYDWFGKAFQTSGPVKAEAEELWRVDAVSGEPVIVGESHELLCRKKGEARYKRVSVKELHYYGKPVYVRMPQRKITLDSDILFENLAADEKSIHIIPPMARDLLTIMEVGATAGIGVHRSKGELRVDIEKNRPVCFATKLINGNFDENFERTLEELCSTAIVCPSARFDDQYLEMTKKSGIIHEGWTMFNDTLVVPPRPLGKSGEVYHIKGVGEDRPVELTWFCT